MTRKGLPGEVTFTLTPKHETERAVGTAKEAVFQAEGSARAETGPRLGFGIWVAGQGAHRGARRAGSARLQWAELGNQGAEFRFRSQRVRAGNHRGV